MVSNYLNWPVSCWWKASWKIHVALDLYGPTSSTGYFVSFECNEQPSVEAIADNIRESSSFGLMLVTWKVDNGGWRIFTQMLLFAIFTEDERAHYNLEKLWHEAPRDVSLFGIKSELSWRQLGLPLKLKIWQEG